jgi:hypothetical protein
LPQTLKSRIKRRRAAVDIFADFSPLSDSSLCLKMKQEVDPGLEDSLLMIDVLALGWKSGVL